MLTFKNELINGKNSPFGVCVHVHEYANRSDGSRTTIKKDLLHIAYWHVAGEHFRGGGRAFKYGSDFGLKAFLQGFYYCLCGASKLLNTQKKGQEIRKRGEPCAVASAEPCPAHPFCLTREVINQRWEGRPQQDEDFLSFPRWCRFHGSTRTFYRISESDRRRCAGLTFVK